MFGNVVVDGMTGVGKTSLSGQEMYYKTGDMKPEEYFVYKSLFRLLVDSLKSPKLVIYLDVSLHEVIRRIKMRGRNDELNVPDSYWRDLLETYTMYYDNYKLSPLLKINVNDLDFVNNPQDTSKIVEVFENRFNGVKANEYSA